MHPFIHRFLFIIGCVLILVGAVLLFRGSTQVASNTGSIISIAGLLISYIQVFFPTPIFAIKSIQSNTPVQSQTSSNQLPSNAALSSSGRYFTFFLTVFIAIPVITFIKDFYFISRPEFIFLNIVLGALAGIGISILIFHIISLQLKIPTTINRRLVVVISLSLSMFALAMMSCALLGISLQTMLHTITNQSRNADIYLFLFAILLVCIFISVSLIDWESMNIKPAIVFYSFCLYICAELVFLSLILYPQIFMNIDERGSFITQSYNLFSPNAILIFLTGIFALLFASAFVGLLTPSNISALFGGIAIMYGIGLFVFQITPVTITIGILNLLIGITMFFSTKERTT